MATQQFLITKCVRQLTSGLAYYALSLKMIANIWNYQDEPSEDNMLMNWSATVDHSTSARFSSGAKSFVFSVSRQPNYISVDWLGRLKD